MNLTPLINQLAQVLPAFTDKFSDTISVTSLTRSGSVATAVTITDHGYSTGQFVNIVGAVEVIPITSLTFDSITNNATGTTVLDNGLSLGMNFKDRTTTLTVDVEGATESEYNGTLALIDLPNRNNFIYKITGTPSTPATGSPVLLNYAFNRFVGTKEITVVNPTTFTYVIDSTASVDTTGTIIAHSKIRISGAATDNRAIDSYTKQLKDKYWMFLTGGDSFTSKNRDILNDAVQVYRKNHNEYRLRLIEDLGMLIFIPTADEISGMDGLNNLENIKPSIFKSLLRFPSDDQYSAATDFVYTYNSGSILEYNAAYLVYKLVFDVNFDVTYFDTYNVGDSAPLLNIDLNLTINNQGLIANINLDKDPNF